MTKTANTIFYIASSFIDVTLPELTTINCKSTVTDAGGGTVGPDGGTATAVMVFVTVGSVGMRAVIRIISVLIIFGVVVVMIFACTVATIESCSLVASSGAGITAKLLPKIVNVDISVDV